MSMIEKGAYALVGTALLTGLSAWGMNQIGLDKKVMRTTAPTFVNAAKYGAIRGLLTFGITALSVTVHKQVSDDWAKVAISIVALIGLYLTVDYTAKFARTHLDVKIPEQFTYLALLAEFGCFFPNRA